MLGFAEFFREGDYRPVAGHFVMFDPLRCADEGSIQQFAVVFVELLAILAVGQRMATLRRHRPAQPDGLRPVEGGVNSAKDCIGSALTRLILNLVAAQRVCGVNRLFLFLSGRHSGSVGFAPMRPGNTIPEELPLRAGWR